MSAQQRFSVGAISAVAFATIGITVALAFLFISPEDRGQKFFLTLGSILFAETLILGDALLEAGRSGKNRATLPFNLGMSSVLVIYLVVTFLLAAIAATPISLTILISGHLIALLGLIVFLGIWAISGRYVAERDIETRNQRATMLEMRRNCAAIVQTVEGYTSEDFLPLRKAVQSLNEELKYAATTSSDKSVEIDGRIAKFIEELEKKILALHKGDGGSLEICKDHVSEIHRFIKEREGLLIS